MLWTPEFGQAWSCEPDPLLQKREGSGELCIRAISAALYSVVQSCCNTLAHDTLQRFSSNNSLDNNDKNLTQDCSQGWARRSVCLPTFYLMLHDSPHMKRSPIPPHLHTIKQSNAGDDGQEMRLHSGGSQVNKLILYGHTVKLSHLL